MPIATLSFTVDNFLEFLGRLHPTTVHFPIALILTALLFEAVAAVRRGPRRSILALQCLALGAVAAGVSAWLGWVNAEQEPYGRSVAQTIFLHRWSGVAAAALAGLSLVAGLLVREGRPIWALRAYRGGLLVCGGLIMFGGYLGAELVHGRNHLLSAFQTEPTRPETPRVMPATPADVPAVELVSFERQIAPILETHCVHCHGDRRQRGDLRLDDPVHIFEEGRDHWVIVPGDVEASELVERITLPADHPDVMPADDDPLPAEQVELIKRWIAQGAPVERSTSPRTAQANGDQRPAPEPAAAEPPDVFGVTLTEPQRAARDAAIAALRERGAVAARVSLDSQSVDVNMSLLDPPATNGDLELLEGLERSLVWLDLARSSVTDEGVATLGGFGELRRLRLDRTPITDTAIGHLQSLQKLHTLNLHGTAISDAGAAQLAALPALRQVYLWGTAVSEQGAAALAAARPELSIDLGAPALVEPETTAALASFRETVLPIFEASCVHCHGPDRQRAGLRLDALDLVMRGAENGPVVVAGDSEASELVQRIILPADHEDLMPADDDPLDESSVATIRTWIDALERDGERTDGQSP